MPRPSVFSLAVLAAGIFYTGFALSPSSYAIVLREIGAPGAGPVAGAPRMERSDEWGVWTPYFQIAVRNGFERFNRTSPYHEDLRNINALPLRDWGIVLKPSLWGFFLLPPARAFSLYHFFQIAAFLIGYRLLLLRLGLGGFLSAAGSLLLFFSGFVQFWWTTSGPCFAMYPWLALALFWRSQSWLKYAAIAYFCAAWVIIHPYAPFILSLIYLTVVLFAALRDRALLTSRNALLTAASLAAGIGLIYLYFADLIAATLQTVYPGDRIAPPGTVGAQVLLSHSSPFLTFVIPGFRNLIGRNICENSVVGSFLLLGVICFTDYQRVLKEAGTHARRYRLLLYRAGVCACGAAPVAAWVFVPAPLWMGRMFGWHKAEPQRLLFALGILLLLVLLYLVRYSFTAVTVARCAAFAALVAVADLGLKMRFSAGSPFETLQGSPILCLAMAVPAFAGVSRPERMKWALAGMVLANATVFGVYNPFQPAAPIFDVPRTAAIRRLERLRDRRADGILAEPDYFGATLNGLGFRSINHVLISPMPRFFRPYFPGMSEAQFNQVFRRYAHIQLDPEAGAPFNPAPDVIVLPLKPFLPAESSLARQSQLAGKLPAAVSVDKSAAARRPGSR